MTDHVKAAKEKEKKSDLQMEFEGIWLVLSGKQKKKGNRVVFKYLRCSMKLTLITFLHRKEKKKDSRSFFY